MTHHTMGMIEPSQAALLLQLQEWRQNVSRPLAASQREQILLDLRQQRAGWLVEVSD